MNCPKCGLQTLPGQKFCRSCGDNLQIITQPLAEHAAVSRLEKTPAINSKNEVQRANGLTHWGFIVMFTGVAFGIIGKMLMHQEMITAVGVLVSIVGMFLTVYPYLLPSPRQKNDSVTSPQKEVLIQSQRTKYLPQESNTEFVPSVTERTTTLLEKSASSKPKEKEGRESDV